MVILTIDEAAQFLRVTKRTLYRRPEIPRVRIGHQIKFIREDLEAWVVNQRVGQLPVHLPEQNGNPRVDEHKGAPYHRNPIFRLPSARSA